MKKLLTIAVLLVSLAAAVLPWVWSDSAGAAPAPAGAAPTAQPAPARYGGDAAPAAGAGAAEREAVAPAPAAPSAGWHLSGVVTAEGQPADGATLQVTVPAPEDGEVALHAIADADGRYQFDLEPLRALPPIDLERVLVRIQAWRDGCRTEFRALPLAHQEPERAMHLEHDVDLRAAAVAVGRVVDERGEPVAGAAVRLEPAPEGARPVHTGADGGFRLPADDVEGQRVLASHAAVGEGSAPVALRAGRDVAVGDVVLRAAATLRGRLVLDDGQPAAWVGVEVDGRRAETDADGAFSFALEPGRYEVLVRDAGLGRVGELDTAAGVQTLVLRDHYLLLLSYVDEQGRALRPLEVYWRRFAAEHAAALHAFDAGGGLPVDLPSRRGGGESRSHLLPAGSWLWVQSGHGDRNGEVLVQAEAPGSVIRRQLRLEPQRLDAGLRLQVRSDDSGPVGDLRVSLRQQQLGRPGLARLSPTEVGAAGGGARTYQVPSGRYLLRVAPAFRGSGAVRGYLSPVEQVVDLMAGQETPLDVTLPANGRVRLDVRAAGVAAGAAIPDFACSTEAATAQPSGRRRQFFYETEGGVKDGRICCERPAQWGVLLPPGRHVLTLRSRDHREEHVAVVVRPREVVDVQVQLHRR